MTSPEHGALAVLVPASEPERGDPAAEVYFDDDNMLLISTRAAALVVKKQNAEPPMFVVEKLMMDEASALDFFDLGVAVHGVSRYKILRASDSDQRAILLGPTMIGNNLYSVDISPDRELEAQYGSVRPVKDEGDGWGLRIVMPNLPYRDILSEVYLHEAK
jgi:hypothetical protein